MPLSSRKPSDDVRSAGAEQQLVGWASSSAWDDAEHPASKVLIVTYHPKPAIGYRVKPGHLSGDDIVLQHGATGVTKAAGTIIATEPAAT